MAGFSTYDSIINALTVNGKGQRAWFNKTSFTSAAALTYDLWLSAGQPPAGTFGTALTGRIIDNSFAAALKYTNATSPATMALLSAGIGSTIALGSILLYDRLAEYPFDSTVTSGSWNSGSGIALPNRDANGSNTGAGCVLIVQNFSGTANTGQTFTPTYTDSGGVDRTAAGTLLASGTSGKQLVMPTGNTVFWPLNAASTGVRLLKSYTLSASATSTQMCATIIRPLAVIPMLTANGYVERDLVLQLASMPKLYDGTALGMILIANTTTCPCFGSVVFAEN
jgi:hypothetical protein